MSEDEHRKGKLVYRGKCNEENAEHILRDETGSFTCIEESCHSSYVEMLRDTVCDFVILEKDESEFIYEILEEEVSSSNELFHAQKTQQGYNFEVIYYNGGCGLDEALQEAINSCK